MSETAPFWVEFDSETGLFTVTLHGHWTVATMAAYSARLLVEAAKLRWRREPFDVLCDARDYPVQSNVVAGGFSKVVDIGLTAKMGSLAIVVAGMLSKLQAERTMNAPRLRIFLSMDEAREWLLQEKRERPAMLRAPESKNGS